MSYRTKSVADTFLKQQWTRSLRRNKQLRLSGSKFHSVRMRCIDVPHMQKEGLLKMVHLLATGSNRSDLCRPTVKLHTVLKRIYFFTTQYSKSVFVLKP